MAPAAFKTAQNIRFPDVRRAWMLPAIGAVWMGALIVGTAAMWAYAGKPGAVGVIVPQWPLSSEIALDPARPTLVMALHPRCSCSRASLAELEELMAHFGDKIAAVVLVANLEERASNKVAVEKANALVNAIPGVTAIADPAGHLSQKLGAETSGQVFLYDPTGTLLFNGGITASRGHAGDNDGRATIERIVLANQAPTRSTPVYGCSLR